MLYASKYYVYIMYPVFRFVGYAYTSYTLFVHVAHMYGGT